jgi:hypothetical protein
MRTTVTLDPDVEAQLKRVMRRRGISFKAALNQAIRDGLTAPASRSRKAFVQKTYGMGYRPEVALDKALRLAADLEDEEIARKLSLRK